MKTRPFGKTGIHLTEIGLGTWGLGGAYYGKVERAEGVRAVQAYLDAGGNHIDAAFSYQDAEATIGEAIRGRDRSRIVLASKSYSTYGERLADLRAELEISLRTLGTDYLDLYYLHLVPDEADALSRALDLLTTLKAEGKIRAVCASLKGPSVTPEVAASGRHCLASGQLDGVQMIYSVLRQANAPFFAEARAAGVGVIARTVLESGLLTGKYAPGHTFTWPDPKTRYTTTERDAALSEAAALARDLPPGYTGIADLAVGFALANTDISGVVLGGTSVRQVARNTAQAALPPLPPAWVERLRAHLAARNHEFNPTAPFEHIHSTREGFSA